MENVYMRVWLCEINRKTINIISMALFDACASDLVTTYICFTKVASLTSMDLTFIKYNHIHS